MLCDNCHKEPATVYVRRTINGETVEVHLCERCAREQGEWSLLIGPSMAFPDFSLGSLFASLIDQQAGPAPGLAPDKKKACPECGLTYAEFRRHGRLGCAQCYETFDTLLQPLIERLQGGVHHVGKVPIRYGATARLKRDLEILKKKLTEAVASEKFEQAAELRDEIRTAQDRLAGGR